VTRIRRFIAEAISELRKVSWPTFAQTRNLTVLVFAVSFAVGVFVAVADALFINARNFLVNSGIGL
jgi:preprotein translocase subunit SecE